MNYLHFNCLNCEKVLEYAVPSDLMDSDRLEDLVPMACLIIDGGAIACSCGKLNQLKYNRNINKMEVIVYGL